MYPFEKFPENVKNVLLALESRDSSERDKGTERKIRLRQIPRESGNYLFLNVFQLVNIVSNPIKGLEIGSSGGYSTIFQAMALKHKRSVGNKLITLEVDPVKVELAIKNFREAGLLDVIDILEVDAKKYCQKLIRKNEKFDFFFLDAEKEDYIEYFNYIRQLSKSGSILFADNVISHSKDLAEFLKIVELDESIFSSVIPIGKGILKAVYL